jgi:uncharacterized protein with GYD domain
MRPGRDFIHKESDVAKYLIKATYLAEGEKGLLRDGGTGRRDAVKKAIEGLGGKLEEFYYAFGDVDAYVIVDAPNATSALALTIAVNSVGSVHVQTIPLLTCEEVDAACHMHISYRGPGAA